MNKTPTKLSLLAMGLVAIITFITTDALAGRVIAPHPANPQGVLDPRGVANPRGIADPRGPLDPR